MLEELKVLKRIAIRGRNLSIMREWLDLDPKGRMADMWEHMETEIDRLIKTMEVTIAEEAAKT